MQNSAAHDQCCQLALDLTDFQSLTSDPIVYETSPPECRPEHKPCIAVDGIKKEGQRSFTCHSTKRPVKLVLEQV